MNRALTETAHRLKEKPIAVPERSARLLAELKEKEREIERLKRQLSTASADAAREDIKTINGINVLARKVVVDTPAGLREMADHYRDKLKSGVIVLGAVTEGKALLISAVTNDLADRFHAGDIVKEIAAVVGGRGGGRPDMAQAGGPRAEKLDAALDKVAELIASQ
jgi:alanyl-tRNA synthetase